MSGSPELRMSLRAEEILQAARGEAGALSHEYIGTEHLLLALCRSELTAKSIVERIGLDPVAVADRVEESIRRGRVNKLSLDALPFTSRAQAALENAAREATSSGSTQIEPEHIFLGLLQDRKSIATVVLESFGTALEKARLASSRMA